MLVTFATCLSWFDIALECAGSFFRIWDWMETLRKPSYFPVSYKKWTLFLSFFTKKMKKKRSGEVAHACRNVMLPKSNEWKLKPTCIFPLRNYKDHLIIPNITRDVCKMHSIFTQVFIQFCLSNYKDHLNYYMQCYWRCGAKYTLVLTSILWIKYYIFKNNIGVSIKFIIHNHNQRGFFFLWGLYPLKAFPHGKNGYRQNLKSEDFLTIRKQ